MPKATPLYLGAGLKLGFDRPRRRSRQFDEYVSDPAKPVPFIVAADATERTRLARSGSSTISARRRAGRMSLVFVSDVLTAPVKISGQPIANLVASTSGTDSDWVVKVIDVYPDEVAAQPGMGGYQLMVSADIFRGRYRESLETPKAITSDEPLALHVRAADGEPRLPAGPPDDGADPVELVPALRPQPADVRAEHLLGEAGGLQEGDAADLARGGRSGELHRAAAGERAMTAKRTSHRKPGPKKDPAGDARFARVLAGLRTELEHPVTMGGLKSWISDAVIDRTSFMTDTVWGTIRWKKSVGRSLGSTLASGFRVRHFFHEIRGSDLGGGIVKDESRWVEGPAPSVWDMPDDAENHNVGYMFWVKRPWINAVTVNLAEKQAWGSALRARASTTVRTVVRDRQDFWMDSATTFAVLDETTVVQVPVRVFG